MEELLFLAEAKALLNAHVGLAVTDKERGEAAVLLSRHLLNASTALKDKKEEKKSALLLKLLGDEKGFHFILELTDRLFRTKSFFKTISMVQHLLKTFGVPRFLPWYKRFLLSFLKNSPSWCAFFFVPLMIRLVHRTACPFVISSKPELLKRYLDKRTAQGFQINVNQIGEMVLSEEEAKRRLELNLNILKINHISQISIKISTLYSQLSLLAKEEALHVLKERLRPLYLEALHQGKSVHLDMEEYKDLHLTVDLFRTLLDEPEFLSFSAGIALQSYLPDSFLVQQELTAWAMERLKRGGAPVSIRLVKGANRSMERAEASLSHSPEATYHFKDQSDANFKRMLHFGAVKERAQAVHLRIGSHNLFDIAYALILRVEKGLEQEIGFEMLEGMSEALSRVVKEVAGGLRLYVPLADFDNFHFAVAYLVRRFEEATAHGHFLRSFFSLSLDSSLWEKEKRAFLRSLEVPLREKSFRAQDRLHPHSKEGGLDRPFEREEDTDFSLVNNVQWAEEVTASWKEKRCEDLPLVLNGEEMHLEEKREVYAAYEPTRLLYRYSEATLPLAARALETALYAEKEWGRMPPHFYANLLLKIAEALRLKRGDLIGAMMVDTAKVFEEADKEVSEAVDAAEYYARELIEFTALDDVTFSKKGVLLVLPPWNFPLSLPALTLIAALAGGNVVLFKPAPEAVLVGWVLSEIFWSAGVPRTVLQFLPAPDEPVGSFLVKDRRVQLVALTGSLETAKLLLNLRPSLDLIAETGGKNSLIITEFADRELAIRDLVASAFGHAGQKCSACSLAICTKEVYDDPKFRQSLKEAAESLKCGSPFDLATKVNPLIRPPAGALKRALNELEEGEEWLLKPEQDPANPHLVSPGIKLHVKPGSFTHQTELFGPLLALIRAKDLGEALQIANQTPYGLTAGLHSLDEGEQESWLGTIQAGNCYINRKITGALVHLQPFGGTKGSIRGHGFKVGGPNSLIPYMKVAEIGPPSLKEPIADELLLLLKRVTLLNPEEMKLLRTALGSYAYWWKQLFLKGHEMRELLPFQENRLRYVPEKLALRVLPTDALVDVYLAVGAALTVQARLDVSFDRGLTIPSFQKIVSVKEESDEEWLLRMKAEDVAKVRFLSLPKESVLRMLNQFSLRVILRPALVNGRLELLNSLREVSISRECHRYGKVL